MDYSPLFKQFEEDGEGAGNPPYVTPNPGYGPLLEEEADPGRNVMVLGGKLILAPVREGLAVISIKKAQEAILYHKYFEFLSQERFISQRSLYPQQVALQSNIYSVILENMERLSQLGFDIRDFGDNTIIVYAVPDGFPTEEEALKDVMDSLASSLDGELAGENIASYARTLASAAAKKLNHKLNAVQAEMIANQVLVLRATHGTDLSPKCIAIVSNEELERKI
jgi:DNA mismatch repair protein MutL